MDADYDAYESDRKSVSGYGFFLGDAAFSWYSKKQTTVATSTMEAEFIAIFHGSQQGAWIRQFYDQIGLPLQEPLAIFSDSQSAIAVAKGEQTHQRSKHLDVKLMSVRERIDRKQVSLDYVSTKDNCADIFTKSLSRDLFQFHVEYLGFVSLDEILPTSNSPEGDTSISQYVDAE